MKRIRITELLIFIFTTELIGVISGIIAGNTFGIYSELAKPPLSPPSGIFPVAWAILYALMGTSLYIAYYDDKDNRKNNLILYGIQLFVNFMWSIIFFRFRLFGASAIIILILILLVIKMIMQFGKSNKVAGYINIPYLIWLIYALYLNTGVFFLNP